MVVRIRLSAFTALPRALPEFPGRAASERDHPHYLKTPQGGKSS
jgi:hypothetical protein